MSAQIPSGPVADASVSTTADGAGDEGRARGRRWVRRLAWAGGTVLVAWGAGWLALPPLAKWQAQKQASELLGRAVTIGHIDFKPWSLELTLQDLQVAGADGGAPQVSVARIYVNAAAQSLWRLAPVLDAIEVDAPKMRVRHLGEGRYDFDDVLARLAARPSEPPDPNAKPARFALYNVALRGGEFTFDDDPVQGHHELRALDVQVPFISNLDSQREVKALPRLAFVLDGSHFDSAAETLPFIDTRKTDARFKVQALDLSSYAAYVPASVPVALKSAVLDADLTLSFEQHEAPSLRIGGTLSASGFEVQERDGTPLAAFERLELDLADVRPLAQQIHLSAVRLTGPRVRVARDPQGLLNLLRLAKATAQEGVDAAKSANGSMGELSFNESAVQADTAQEKASNPAIDKAEPAATLNLRIDRVAIAGGDITWLDQAAGLPEQPANLRLARLQVDAADVAWPMDKPVRFSGSGVLSELDEAAPAAGVGQGEASAVVNGSAGDSVAGGSAQKADASRANGAHPPASAVAAASATAAGDAAQTGAAAASAPAGAGGAGTGSSGQPVTQPVPAELPALRAQADLPEGGMSFAGEATQRAVTVQANVQALPLALATPYVRPYLVPHVAGRLSASYGLRWAQADAGGEGGKFSVRVAQASLDDLALHSPNKKAVSGRRKDSSNGKQPILPSIKQVSIENVEVLPLAQRVHVARIAITAPQAQVSRDAKGRLMYEDWLVTPPKPAAAPGKGTAAQAQQPWQVALDEVQLKGGRVGWRDEQPARAVDVTLSELAAGIKGFELGGRKPMQLQLDARLGAGRLEPGRLSWRGSLALEPLAAKGEANLQRLPVHAFEPYFGGLLNIELLRADASFKGRVDYASGNKGPRVQVAGDASVEEFRAHSVSGSITDERAPGTAATAAASTTQRQGGVTQTTSAAPVPTRAQAQRGQAGAARALADGSADVQGGNIGSRAPLAPVAGRQGRGGLRLGEELLSWKTLHARGLNVDMQPGARPRVTVAQTRLADFFARVVIHPDGRLNLQDVVKAQPGDEAAAAPAGAASAPAAVRAPAVAVAPASAAAPAGTAVAAQAPADGPILRFGPTQLVGGKVYFSDRFIKPNYSADLTELNGSLSAFSSEPDPSGAVQMADLALSGRAEGSAVLDISGKVNPLAKPLALDVTGKVHDLELPPLSPYAIKYAGYGIERGKMSVDVHYEVLPSGQLTASNKLVLNQLTFGDKVEGAPASLPVKLAVTLLSDRNGVIDLELPLSGSLNDPQFSIGPIIGKAIVNIIGKALTAPFTLLAKAFGGAGDEMSQVAFAPGSSRLEPQARQNLDKVAKALLDRPALKLTVGGRADLDAERTGYQRERLKALVAAEKRRDEATGGKAGEDDATAMPAAPAASAASIATVAMPEITGAEYETLLKKVYRRADIKKPRNAIGLAKDLPVPEMERLLMDSIPVGENQMRQLAQARATAVRDYLAGRQLPGDRLFVGALQLGQKGGVAAPAGGASEAGSATPAKGWTPHAELSLKND